MRSTLEKKLEKSASSLEEQRKQRQQKLNKQSEDIGLRRGRAQALREELEGGLELWCKQVQEVQEHNMRRAGEQVREELQRKQETAGKERRSRSRRASQRRKESQEREEQELKQRREAIEKKN